MAAAAREPGGQHSAQPWSTRGMYGSMLLAQFARCMTCSVHMRLECLSWNYKATSFRCQSTVNAGWHARHTGNAQLVTWAH